MCRETESIYGTQQFTCVGLGAAGLRDQSAKAEVLSGHFQNSLEDDCKPVVADTSTKGATENKANGYGRSVCDTEKQRRPRFKKRNQEILKMEKTFCGPLFSSFVYLSTVTHTHLAIHLIITVKKLMSGSALNFRYKEGNCSTCLQETYCSAEGQEKHVSRGKKEPLGERYECKLQGTGCVSQRDSSQFPWGERSSQGRWFLTQGLKTNTHP